MGGYNMKIIKLLLILLLPTFIFANNIEYELIHNISMEKEGNLTKITKINNEEFKFFTIYMDNETSKKLNENCTVKFKDGYFSLSTGKPFKCGDEYLELINKEIPEHYINTFEHNFNGFYYEFLLSNIGKLITLILFFLTFIIYLFTNKGSVLFFGIIVSIIIGFIIGVTSIMGWVDITGQNEPPYSKTYLIKYYDDIEKQEEYKVFRKGFYK